MGYLKAGEDLFKFVQTGVVEKAEKAMSVASKTTLDMPIIFGPSFSLNGSSIRQSSDVSTKLAEFESAHDAILIEIASELNEDLKAMLKASWGWSTGARDIVETGALMASGGAALVGDSIEIGYAAAYANLVHNGGYVQPYGNANVSAVYIPGRPWVAAVLGEAEGPESPYPFEERYASKMRDKIS